MTNRRKGWSPLLYIASLMYGFAVGFRHILFNMNVLSSREFNIPVISVGNITVGGTGKTPLIEYITGLLKKEFSVATLSRGYKRKTKGFLLASGNSTPSQIGDEPAQIYYKNTDITVAVDEKRARGIDKLLSMKDRKIQVILLDDAFQHRYVRPGMSILLIDYNRPLWNDHLLPYGNLRERIHHKDRANIIIVTKMPAEIKPIERRILEKDLSLFPYQTLYFSTVKYKNPVTLFPGRISASNFSFTRNKYDVLLVTGIACPDELKKHVKKFSLSVTHLSFKDHHTFREKDLKLIADTFNNLSGERILITTEKDSLRLLDAPGSEYIENIPSFYIPIEIDFLYQDKNRFNKQIIDYVRKNKPVSSIYK